MLRMNWAFELATFRETRSVSDKAMIAGGASRSDIAKYNRWYEGYTQGLLNSDEKLRTDTTFSAGAMYLIAGRKV